MDARKKLQEIAARDLGGNPDDYELGGERVFRRGNPGRGLTYAQAATRALALGGRYDGHELPDDIHPTTKAAATALAGLGLMGVAKDVYKHDGTTFSFVAGFAEVEVDLETGKPTLIDYFGMADIGTVINPRSMAAQVSGGPRSTPSGTGLIGETVSLNSSSVGSLGSVPRTRLCVTSVASGAYVATASVFALLTVAAPATGAYTAATAHVAITP